MFTVLNSQGTNPAATALARTRQGGAAKTLACEIEVAPGGEYRRERAIRWRRITDEKERFGGEEVPYGGGEVKPSESACSTAVQEKEKRVTDRRRRDFELERI